MIAVAVPVETAYQQWMQIEAFPRFIPGVESVRWLAPHRLHRVARIGEQRTEWIARIAEMIPQQRIAWRSEGGRWQAGFVTFHPLSAQRTHIVVRLEYEPEGAIEALGGQLGVVSRRVETDLLCFKDFAEACYRGGGQAHDHPAERL